MSTQRDRQPRPGIPAESPSPVLGQRGHPPALGRFVDAAIVGKDHPFGKVEVLVDSRAVTFDDGAAILRRQWERGTGGRVVWTLQFLDCGLATDRFLRRLEPVLAIDGARTLHIWIAARALLRELSHPTPVELDLVPIRGGWYTFIRDPGRSSGRVSGRAQESAYGAVSAARRRFRRRLEVERKAADLGAARR